MNRPNFSEIKKQLSAVAPDLEVMQQRGSHEARVCTALHGALVAIMADAEPEAKAPAAPAASTDPAIAAAPAPVQNPA